MSRKQRGHEEGHGSSERWLVTYSDLITLLLAFFIIMYSMSNVDAEKYRALAGSLADALGGGGGGKSPARESVEPGNKNPKESKSKSEEAEKAKETAQTLSKAENVSPEFKDLVQKIEKITNENGLGSGVVIREEGRGLVLQLTDSLLFQVGQAQLQSMPRHALLELGKVLGQITNHIRVEGHTDNVPIHTYLYPNNWHLSTARAMAVVDYWDAQHLIPADRLSGAGYGEHRPIATNGTAQGRAQNRRVDIVIIRNSVAAQEPKAVPENGGQKTDMDNMKTAAKKDGHESSSETKSVNTHSKH